MLVINTKFSFVFHLLCTAIFCMFFSACYSPPFQETELVPVDVVDPKTVVEDFENRLPKSYETENTIIFRFFRNEIAGLGYASVDKEAETFEIVCLNHMGMQLFHISGDQDGNHLRHAMPEFREHPEFVDAVGNDIRLIYFDLIPPDSAEARIHRDRSSFRHPREDKTIEYVFGGEEKALLKKRAGTFWRRHWEVTFYEYFTESGDESDFMFPGGIILHNRRHRYRLIIKTRSVEL